VLQQYAKADITENIPVLFLSTYIIKKIKDFVS